MVGEELRGPHAREEASEILPGCGYLHLLLISSTVQWKDEKT